MEIKLNRNSIDNDKELINRLHIKQVGEFKLGSEIMDGELLFDKKTSEFRVGEILDLDINNIEMEFISDEISLSVIVNVLGHNNNLKIKEKFFSRFSKGNLDKAYTKNFGFENKGYYRCYFHLVSRKILYDYFNVFSFLKVEINKLNFVISDEDDFLLIESLDKLEYALFSDICYSLMIAIGFISGDFIQDSSWTFHYKDHEKNDAVGFLYKNLRPRRKSIYQAVLNNPYGYDKLLGLEMSEQLYKDETQKYCDVKSLANLVEIINQYGQIQYALVLFLEAIANGNSLLIKNNSLFVVLEVLRKFLHDKYINKLPKNYNSLPNTKKSEIVFSCLTDLSENEIETLGYRNYFFHGDIKDIEGKRMIDIFHSQLTIIYKLVFSYIEYTGYIIDHYSLRNNRPESAYTKV